MRTRRSVAAFTLIELVVSMVVLVLLVTAVAAMVNAVSATTTAERSHLASDDEARKVFDRMANDFAKMVKRADADSIFASNALPAGAAVINDKMFFYSEAPAYYDPSAAGVIAANVQGTTALIGYRVPNTLAPSTANRWQLERLGKGLSFDTATTSTLPGAMMLLTFPAAYPSPTPTPYPASTLAGGYWGVSSPSQYGNTFGTAGKYYDDYDGAGSGEDPDYHVLSSSVFRLEYCFALKTLVNGVQQYATTHTQSSAFTDVSAIIVAIAVLGPQGRALMPGGATADLTNLVAALPYPNLTANPPVLMNQAWDTAINTAGFATTAGIPQGAMSQIRVYQRTFYLNTPPTP
jgi:hypothetical protein